MKTKEEIISEILENSNGAWIDIAEESFDAGVAYASHPSPMSAEPTVQQLRDAAKNNPDTFLAGALYVIDNYKLNSHPMSAEQVDWESFRDKFFKQCTHNDSMDGCMINTNIEPSALFEWFKHNLPVYTTPSVKADGCQHDCVAKDMYWKQCHKCGMILPIN